jgi:hypothetical protein
MQVVGTSASSVKEASYSKTLLNFYQTKWYKVRIKTKLLNIAFVTQGKCGSFRCLGLWQVNITAGQSKINTVK